MGELAELGDRLVPVAGPDGDEAEELRLVVTDALERRVRGVRGPRYSAAMEDKKASSSASLLEWIRSKPT